MAVIATESMRYSNLVKREYGADWGYCKKMVTLNDAAATLPIGSVLGVVTATGKYKLCDVTAADGSQTAVAVLVGDAMGHAMPIALAANTDTQALVIYRGPVAVSDAALHYAATIDTPTEIAAAQNQLRAVGIDVLTTI